MNDRLSDHSRRMLEEHEHLREMVINLIGFFNGDPRSAADTAQVIGELIDELKVHFASEEEGGYLAAALAQAPRLTTKADALLEQHARFLEESSKLHNHAQNGDGASDWWSSIHSDFQIFAERLHAHELAENDLVQAAFTDDIGAED